MNSDIVLLKEMEELVKKESKLLTDMLTRLMKIEKDKTYADLGYCSLYEYLVVHLKYSEYDAYNKASALKLSKGSEKISNIIESREITLSNVSKIQSYVEKEEAKRKVKIPIKEKEKMVEVIGRRSSKDTDRILRQLSFDMASRKVKIYVYDVTVNKLERYKKVNGSHTDDEIISKLLDDRLYSNSRYLSKKVKDSVFLRADERCEFKSEEGRRCSEKRFLEIDHIRPHALGGSNSIDNLRLYCKTHNRRAAIKTFGAQKIQNYSK